MRTIHKYPLIPGITKLTMPQGAQLLTVHEQDGAPRLWALVDTDQPEVVRRFEMVGTGHEIKEWPIAYVGTAHLRALVLHIFEVK